MTSTATTNVDESPETSSDQDVLRRLMAQFPADEVGKLPRITCNACSNNRGTCKDHPRKAKCQQCGAYTSPQHVHIDYVGHADVTRRLLSVDPDWDWEPVAWDEGAPAFDRNESGKPVGLWIRLTVGGKTRLGYGSVPANQDDAVKVLIGDAIRNAAMRFGVALDLWAKGDRADLSATVPSGAGATPVRQTREQRAERRAPVDPNGPLAIRQRIADLCVAQEWDLEETKAAFEVRYGVPTTRGTVDNLTEYLQELELLARAEADKAAQDTAGEGE